MVRHLRRPAVLVGPEEADVEVVAGKLEIVRVAAEKGDLPLRGEDEPHVGVFLRAVEVVEASLVQGDDVAPQPRGRQRLLLDRREHLAAGLEPLLRRQGLRHGRLHPCRDVLDRHQHVELEIAALDLVGPGGRGEPVTVVVGLLAAEFLQRVGGDVVVREHEPVGRDEAAGAAGVEPDGRLLQVAEPGGSELRPAEPGGVIPLHPLERRLVEEPHPFVAGRDRNAEDHRQQAVYKRPARSQGCDRGGGAAVKTGGRRPGKNVRTTFSPASRDGKNSTDRVTMGHRASSGVRDGGRPRGSRRRISRRSGPRGSRISSCRRAPRSPPSRPPSSRGVPGRAGWRH